MYEVFPKMDCVPEKLEMDFSRILNKPYFVTTIPWTTSNSFTNILSVVKVPLDIFSNSLALIPFEASTLYRAKIKLLLQVSGTPMHQGVVLAAAMPLGFATDPLFVTSAYIINSMMAAPHVYLSANEATSALLEIPFYVNTVLAKTDIDLTTFNPNFSGTNYAEAVFFVLNPLVAPTSGSTSLTISVHAIFTEMEFYSPHTDVKYLPLSGFEAQGFLSSIGVAATKAIDRTFLVARNLVGDILDAGRVGVRTLTGLHSPNNPGLVSKDHVVYRQNQNVVDKPTQYERLDPYAGFDRVCRDYIFDTARDEMDMQTLLAKPQYVGTFQVDSSDPSGVLLWSRPITPFQVSNNYTYFNSLSQSINTTTFGTLQQVFYYLSRYWRGSLKIHLQAVMSNFHYCKLTFARDYSIRLGSLTGYPAFSDVQNLLTETIEFSAGAQVQTLDLPFVSAMNQLPCTLSWENIISQHGMYYIYLNQPLVTNGTVSTSINFNVYISAGDDFEYLGYAVNPSRVHYPISLSSLPVLSEIEDEFEAQAQASEIVNDQSEILLPNPTPLQFKSVDFHPIVNVRDYLRRQYKVFSARYDPGSDPAYTGLFTFDVADLLGLRSSLDLPPTDTTSFSNVCSTLSIISKCFLGCSGGAKIKIVVNGTSSASAWYIPPNFSVDLGGVDPVWGGDVPFPNTTNPSFTQFNNMYETMRTYENNLDPEFSCQSVLQERPNYFTGSILGINTRTATGHVPDNTSILEFEIPNMSPFRFMGDISKVSRIVEPSVGQSVYSNSATTDLGHIVLYIPHSVFVGSTDAGTGYSIYASFDDVARLGYQVFTPNLVIPAVTSSVPGVFTFLTPQCYPLGSAATDGPISQNPYPVCFYTKST